MRAISEAAANLLRGNPERKDARPVDPKMALARVQDVSRTIDPDPHILAANPLIATFLKNWLIPKLDASTIEMVDGQEQVRQTRKEGTANFYSLALSGELLTNRGIKGLRVICTFNYGQHRELSPWELERRGVIEYPLPVGSNLTIRFYTQEDWKKTVEEVKSTHSFVRAGIGALGHEVTIRDIAARPALATSSIDVDATEGRCGVTTWSGRRRNPEGSLLIEPVVKAIAKRLETAVGPKKYLPHLEKAKGHFGGYYRDEKVRIAALQEGQKPKNLGSPNKTR